MDTDQIYKEIFFDGCLQSLRHLSNSFRKKNLLQRVYFCSRDPRQYSVVTVLSNTVTSAPFIAFTCFSLLKFLRKLSRFCNFSFCHPRHWYKATELKVKTKLPRKLRYQMQAVKHKMIAPQSSQLVLATVMSEVVRRMEISPLLVSSTGLVRFLSLWPRVPSVGRRAASSQK